MNIPKDVITAIETAKKIVVIQGENPDGDSLASSLALEHILGDQGKEVSMYCYVAMPKYLRHMQGWDRVSEDLPAEFDLVIIVDTSSASLLERSLTPEYVSKFSKVPVVVIDHHPNENDLPFDTIDYEPETVATGEAVYDIAKAQNWDISLEAAEFITQSIMADSLGLTTEATTAKTIRVVADLVDMGVSLSKLDMQRRQMMKKSVDLVRYKGDLLNRIEYHDDNRVATIHIPWEEIEEYSDAYNPSMLVLEEMRMTEGVKIAVAFKTYPDGKITGKIRANNDAPIAQTIAEHFGASGHPYSAGFKVREGDLDTIKREFINLASKELDAVDE